MNELKLAIENVNPVVVWGPNNEYFETIKKQFPKIKIVARGNEVKVLGDESELQHFNDKFRELLNHADKFQSLNSNDLERILGARITASEQEPVAEKTSSDIL